MSGYQNTNLFAIPDFWKPSPWLEERSSFSAKGRRHEFFEIDIGRVKGPEEVTFFLGKDEPPNNDDTLFFKIPGLPLPSPINRNVSLEGSSSSQAPEPTPAQAPAEVPPQLISPEALGQDDLWLSVDETPVLPTPEFKTWESFEHFDMPHRPPLFATEQGPGMVDALAAVGGDTSGGEKYDAAAPMLDSGAYHNCLLTLALGRGSVLFTWNDEKMSFAPVLAYARISGYTENVLRSFERTCLECGNDSRMLRTFVERAYTDMNMNLETVRGVSSVVGTATPLRVALASVVDRMLLVIQRELGSHGHQAQSLLQLQAYIRPAASLVRYMRDLITRLSAQTTATDDAKLLTTVFEEAQSIEYGADQLLRDFTREILQVVSGPWLAFVGDWLGLHPTSKNTMFLSADYYRDKRSFVRLTGQVSDGGGSNGNDDVESGGLDYTMSEDRIPTFMPDDIARTMFETGRNLRFLWANHPDHPLSNPATFARIRAPALQWLFDWRTLSDLERDALAYERALLQAIHTHHHQGQEVTRSLSEGSAGQSVEQPHQHQHQHLKNRDQNHNLCQSQSQNQHRQQESELAVMPGALLQVYGKSENQIEQGILASMAELSRPITKKTAEDKLTAVLSRRLFGEEGGADSKDRGRDDDAHALGDFTSPHWSLLPLLSFGPVIAAQARVVSAACMRLLFSDHGLRNHLQVQRDFQLLGNGIFCNRLAHALFDSDLAAADQSNRSSSSGGLGLRLSKREMWPPASSELRLVLMGVLADSYYSSRRRRAAIGVVRDADGNGPLLSSKPPREPLPGGMSFAVRDLSPEEMDQCMDPDGLEALDFLQFSYKPPRALAAVLTPAILAKYDRVFKLVLRLLRLSYETTQLVQDDVAKRRRGLGAAAAAGQRDNHTATTASIATRFSREAHHFVNTTMAYFLDVGVGMAWRKFDAWLDDAERISMRDASDAATTVAVSPDGLRERHDQALDEILSGLLLRKRQQPLLQLLYGIFSLVLEFAKVQRELARVEVEASMATTDDNTGEKTKTLHERTGTLYAEFHKKVGVFMVVCSSLSEKEADSLARKALQDGMDGGRRSSGSSSSGSSSLAMLVLMLDYNGTYTTLAR